MTSCFKLRLIDCFSQRLFIYTVFCWSLNTLSCLLQQMAKQAQTLTRLLIQYETKRDFSKYLSELLSHYSTPRPLLSQNSGHLIIPRKAKSTAGSRSFFYLAPKLWNNLPNTVREADTICQFKPILKTHLFNLAYT